MSQFAITANDLRDGVVVYLDATGNWVPCLEDCRLVDESGLDAALTESQQGEASQVVVGVYEIAVVRGDGWLMPERLREQIRAFGPSTHVDFVRADVPGHLSHPDGVEAVRFSNA